MNEFKSFPKFEYYRSKEHLKNVRSLPCCKCGVVNNIQAAHSNSSKFGKGRGIKSSDESCVSLCVNCHVAHDRSWCREIAEADHKKWLKQTANLLKQLGKLLPDAERLLIERGVLK